MKKILVSLFFCVTILLNACAKHPSPTAPVVRQSSHNEIVHTAKKALGVRYKYGGTSPKNGFDCSGLVQWTYAQHGITTPRTAKEQMGMGQAVKRHELRPGDLVGFKIPRRNGYHTGIYVGDGKFIHSPTKGNRVREDHIDSEYWAPKLISMRRIPHKNTIAQAKRPL